MSKIIDLDILVPDDITIKIGGDQYIIPGQPSTETVMKFADMEDKATKNKTAKDNVNYLVELVMLIFNQQSNQVKKENVQKFSLQQLRAVVQIFSDSIQKIESNPN